MSSLEREMKDRIEDRRDLLEKVKDKIEDEKEALQTLTMTVEQKEYVTDTEPLNCIWLNSTLYLTAAMLMSS